MRWLGLVCVALGLVVSCGNGDDGGGGSTRCVPGERNECPGPSGCDGVQVCNEDGTYDECTCDGLGGSGGGSSTGDAGSGADQTGTGNRTSGGSANTAGEGSGTPGGTGGRASGGTGAIISMGGFAAVGGVPECTPEDVSTFEPPAYVPARRIAGACTENEIADYYDRCMMTGPVAGSSCAAFGPGGDSARCGACIQATEVDASSRGPLIVFTVDGIQQWVTNNAGCVELMGEADCAEKMQAAWQCTHTACSVCPTTEWGTTEPYEMCTTDARGGDCRDFDLAARCIMNPETNTSCGGSDFRDMVLTLGMVFCG